MIGTIVNTAAIVAGSTIGSIAKKGLGEKYQDVLFCAMGLAATGLGLHSVIEGMNASVYPVLFIISLAIGGVVGCAIDIEGRFNRLTERLARPRKTDGQEAPAGASRGANLSRGLSTGIVLFCFGTLSILGPINSALYGDETFLFTNATLDFVTSIVLASSFGIGMALAGAVLFCWQGSIFLLAQWLAPLMTADLMAEITVVGGFLIMASGLSILKIKEISVMNLLPALLVPPIWFAIVPFLPLG